MRELSTSVTMSDETEQVIVVAIDDNAHSEYAITCKFDICLRLRLKVATRPGTSSRDLFISSRAGDPASGSLHVSVTGNSKKYFH